MTILTPHKISGELLEVIHSAQRYLVLVSPYVRMGQWQALASALTAARQRGVKIEAFVRYEADNVTSWEELEALGIRPRLIPNLHAKFYFNESGGLISSLNLLASSHHQAVEIGCKLETAEELEELKDFVKRYLHPHEIVERPDEDDLYLSKEQFTVVLENYLAGVTKDRASVNFHKGSLRIQAVGNTFHLNLDKGANRVFIEGIVSGAEADAFPAVGSKHFDAANLAFELLKGEAGYYSKIGADYTKRLSTTYLDKLRVPEKKELLDAICCFIVQMRAFKSEVRKIGQTA